MAGAEMRLGAQGATVVEFCRPRSAWVPRTQNGALGEGTSLSEGRKRKYRFSGQELGLFAAVLSL